MKKLILNLFLPIVAGCAAIPDGITPITGFDISKYLGKWYEIARLDHSFERGLTRVTAEYSLQEDGGLRVVNRGYSEADKKWKEAVGKAYFAGDSNTGHLKVSFFGPFYGAYVILELDREETQYSLVSGPNRNYLWILSRTPHMETKVKNRLVAKAREMGFDTDKLIYVTH